MNLSLPCDEWDGYIDYNGYGSLTFADPETGRRMPFNVHRLMAAEWFGVVTSRGVQVDHLCRNRKCWEPAHLEIVSRKVNLLRGTNPAADNARKTHCSKGHPFDDENTYHSRGRRYCKECARAGTRAWRARRAHA